MNIALRNNPPRDIIHDVEPTDDERNSLSALVLLFDGQDDEHSIDVVMVGRGELFLRRARDYQKRHAQAQAEWDAWDDIRLEWSEAHVAKLYELGDKYDLGSFAACHESRFVIVEVLQPGPI